MGDSSDSRRETTLRRLAHPGRTWMFVVVSLVVAALAFGLGTQVRSADAMILDAREQIVPVYTVVENRSVTQDVRLQGEIVGSDSHAVYAKRPDGVTNAVVTNAAVKPGEVLTSGTLLGKVSDRPVFVLALEAPLFRDIRAKDSGSDVSRLQKGLGVPQTGVMNWQTMQVIQDLYTESGALPPGGKGNGTFLRMDEFVSLPPSDTPPVIRSIAKVGTVLDEDMPLAILGLGKSFVNVRASVSEADEIKIGSKTTVQAPGKAAATGKVAAISGFQSEATTAGRPPGRDIRVELPEDSKLVPGQVAAVLFGAKPKPEMAVPTLAIRSDSGGEYVMRRSNTTEPTRARVTVLRNANGWTAVKTTELIIGDEVLVSS